MRTTLAIVIAALTLPLLAQGTASRPKAFIYFGRDRERIAEPSFTGNPGIDGAQLRYLWRELEPERDRYALDAMRSDIATLRKSGKKLFIQIQDSTFSEVMPVPEYLRTDPAFHGGVDRKLEINSSDNTTRFDGWVARRWDPAVRARFVALLTAIGRVVDGDIEGINLPETAIGFEDPRVRPAGFTFDNYLQGVTAIMTAARAAFPRSTVIQYANFMPGDEGDTRYLTAVYAHAAASGVGVGGPDLLPFRRPQRRNSLPLIAARPANVLAGMAVQDGNLADVDPDTGRPVTVATLNNVAILQLRLNYVFWGTQEPYYSRDVLPFLSGQAKTARAGAL